MDLRMYWQLRWVRLTLATLMAIVLCRVTVLTYCEPTHIGIARNLVTGQMWKFTSGWRLKYPWVLVQHIDTRPMKVSVDSAGHGYSAKLVQFVPEEWESYVRTEGFWLWWWANRISFNIGYREENRGMRDILRGYAYGQKRYPFLRIIGEVDQQ